MWPYLTAIKRHLVVVVIFSVAINALMAVSPLYTLQLYDRVLASHSVETLISLTAITLFLLGAMSALDILRNRLLVRAGTALQERIVVRLFNSVVQRMAQNPNEPSHQAQKDLSDIRQFVSGNGLVAFIDAPWAIIFLAIIFAIHPLLGFVALVGAVVLAILAFVAEFATRRQIKDAFSVAANADNIMTTSIRNVDVIRVMGMLDAIRGLWREQQDKAGHIQDAMADSLGTVTALSKAIRLSLQIVMMGVGAWLALQHEITPGIMIASSIMMARALGPAEQALGAWRSFSTARRGYERLNALLSVVPEVADPMPLPRPAARLIANSVVGAAPGTKSPVIRGISLQAQPGTALAIVGPSASGKSTLIRLLVGAWPCFSGDVRLDGIDIRKFSSRHMGRYIGYLPQEVVLFDGTVGENISRFTPASPDDIIRAAKRAGIHETVLKLPEGYDTQIGKRGVILSGGQKQGIGIARALFGDPVLVIMDEPDTHLDDAGISALVRAINDIKNEGGIIIATTHRRTMMSAFDRLAIMRAGQVAHFGMPADVLAKLRPPSLSLPDGHAASAKLSGTMAAVTP